MAMKDCERVLAFVDEFCCIAKRQNVEVYPYLDLEPMRHPEIARILTLARTIDGFSMPVCIPTTGIPIVKRNDWEQVLAAYREAGVRQLEFTMHGPDLHIWYGNGLHRTQELGRVGTTPPTELLRKVLDRYPNYSFGGYFPIDSVPPPIRVGKEVADPQGKRIYHGIDEIHVMWVDKYLTESSERTPRNEKGLL